MFRCACAYTDESRWPDPHARLPVYGMLEKRLLTEKQLEAIHAFLDARDSFVWFIRAACLRDVGKASLKEKQLEAIHAFLDARDTFVWFNTESR